MSNTIRVASYNIQSGNGMDGIYDVPRIAETIKHLNANIVGLQEVRIYSDRPENGDIPAVLSKLTGMTAYFGKAISFPTFEYGIGILSQYPGEIMEKIKLPCVSGTEQRIALVMKINHPAGTFYFITTHFSYEKGFEESRLEQMQTLVNAVKEKGYFPVILTGDLNAVPSEKCVKALAEEWTIADTSHFTFDAKAPFKQIDYIAWYPKNAFRLNKYSVADEPSASDHRPLIAELELC